MANIFDTTITDKSNYIVNILDVEKFTKLSVNEQVIFELLRNSMLEIMPLTKNIHSDECIRYAENYAFINLKAFTTGIEQILNLKLKALEDKLNISIQKIQSSMAATAATAATTTVPTTK